MSPLSSAWFRTATLALGAVAAVAVAVPSISLASTSSASARSGPTAVAAPTLPRPVSKVDRIILTGGGTTLVLDAATAAALSSNKIAVAPTGEAFAGSGGIVFPISAGLIKPQTLAGTVEHTGGLTFTAGGKSLTVRDFTIDTAKKQLFAYVDELKTTVPLLDLDLSGLGVSLTTTTVSLTGVKATLTSGAASALDSYFKTTLFSGGLAIGTAGTSATFIGILVNR